MENLTIEQKIVKHLADVGFLTSIGDVTEALANSEYAEWLITGEGKPGIKDDIKDSIESGEIEGGGTADCDHEPLTNDEIQEVFDNDNK